MHWATGWDGASVCSPPDVPVAFGANCHPKCQVPFAGSNERCLKLLKTTTYLVMSVQCVSEGVGSEEDQGEIRKGQNDPAWVEGE